MAKKERNAEIKISKCHRTAREVLGGIPSGEFHVGSIVVPGLEVHKGFSGRIRKPGNQRHSMKVCGQF